MSCLYSHQEAIYRRSLVTIVLVHLSSSSSSSDENQRYGLVICFQVPRQEYMSDTCSLALTMYDTTPILHLRCSKALQESSIIWSSQSMALHIEIVRSKMKNLSKLCSNLYQSCVQRTQHCMPLCLRILSLMCGQRPMPWPIPSKARAESMGHYKEGKKAYLGIDHIHTIHGHWKSG